MTCVGPLTDETRGNNRADCFTFPDRLDEVRRIVMRYVWLSALLVCFAGLNSADAGLFKKNHCGCGSAPSCCAPAPTCAAPAPSCAAPAAAAPSCCAPAAAPTCAAPAPSCAPTSCCDPCHSCCKTKKHSGLRDWFANLKNKCKKSRCCAPASCCAPAPTCAAPAAAPTCAAPAAACCH